MSTIIFVKEVVPEEKLKKQLNYRAYLSKKEQEEILKELRITVPDIDDYIVHMHVEVELKLYDEKRSKNASEKYNDLVKPKK